jgi:hypothetical protein
LTVPLVAAGIRDTLVGAISRAVTLFVKVENFSGVLGGGLAGPVVDLNIDFAVSLKSAESAVLSTIPLNLRLTA